MSNFPPNCEPVIFEYDFAESGCPIFADFQLCVIPVRIKGKTQEQIFTLLVDTGTSQTLLTPNVIQRIGFNLQPEEQQEIELTSIHGKGEGLEVTVNSLEIGERDKTISLGKEIKVIVTELPDDYSEYYIEGLLGTDILKKICLHIDYPKQYLKFL